MYKPLQSEFFVSNRNRLRQGHFDKLPLVIAGNGLLQRTADSTYSFTQDSNFWYITGLDIPDAIVVLTEKEDEDFIIIPNRSVNRETFDGKIDENMVAHRSGIRHIFDEKAGWNKIKHLVQKNNCASCLFSSSMYQKDHGMYLNPARRRLQNKLQKMCPGIALHDCRKQFSELRIVKQPAEIEQIRHAVHITKAAIEKTVSELKSELLAEEVIEAKITYEMRVNGAKRHAYQPIIAGGAHATTMHYVENIGTIGVNELVLIDVGAEIEHYAADITRTISFSNMNDRQQQIFNAVKNVQSLAISLMKPGANLRTIESTVEKTIGDKLFELGIIPDATDRQKIRQYYPHAVSHFLGLDVHDVGDYNTPLKEGMVLTCEPGIYIAEEQIGIRIEDDILITSNGSVVL